MDELTIAFKIESPPSWLPIGRTAENNWRTVEIDCSYWFNMSADGEVVLMYKPSCGMSPYPLLTEREGDNIIWRPKSGELVEGVGRLQAFFEVGTDVIGSSDMISCEVDSSLLGVEPGTDPGQTELPWALDIIEQIAELSGHYPKIIDGDLYIWDSTLNEWVEFEASGSGAVESVNGKTGVVVLDASDVHALPDSTVIPVVPQMATAADMSDWTSGKTVDAAVLKEDFTAAALELNDLSVNKADRTDIPTAVSELTNDSGFVTAQQAAAAAPVQSVNGMTGAVTIPTGSPDAVLYTPMSLTDAQKEQARENIGAAAVGESQDFGGLAELKTGYSSLPYSLTAGFINGNGSISSATANKEVYTSLIPVNGGEVLDINLALGSEKSSWLAYCVYDSAGAFKRRTVLQNSVTADAYTASLYIPSDASFISLTYRSYGTAVLEVKRPWAALDEIVQVTRNLFNSRWAHISYSNGVASETTTNRNAGTLPEIPVVGGQKYTVSLFDVEYTESMFLYIQQFREDGTFISAKRLGATFPATFTADDGTTKVGLMLYANGSVPTDYRKVIPKRTQIEVGDTATDYIDHVILSDDAVETVWDKIEGNVDSQIALAGAQNKTVQTIAHRGDDIEAPQCTAPSYIAARKRGITIAENDLVLSEDGKLAMWHDDSLSRLGDLVDINGYAMYTDGTDFYWVNNGSVYTWDGTGYVASSAALSSLTRCSGSAYGVNSLYGAIGLPLDVLKRIDFGVYKGEEFKGTQIMTFADWILLCKQLGMECYVDKKLTYTDAIIEEAATTVLQYGMGDHVSWLGLDIGLINKLRQYIPTARCGLLSHPTDQYIEQMKPYNVGRGFFFNGNAKTMVEEDIRKGLLAGFEVEVWHVDYGAISESQILSTIRQAVSYGVTGITLDHYKVDDAFEIALNPVPAERPDGVLLSNVSQLINDSGYQTAQQVQTAIAGKADKTQRITMTAQDTTPTLDPNKLYVFPEMASLAPTLATPTDNSIVNEYHFIFGSGATATTLTIPATINQPDGFTVEANHVYEVSILEGCMTAQGWAVS